MKYPRFSDLGLDTAVLSNTARAELERTVLAIRHRDGTYHAGACPAAPAGRRSTVRMSVEDLASADLDWCCSRELGDDRAFLTGLRVFLDVGSAPILTDRRARDLVRQVEYAIDRQRLLAPMRKDVLGRVEASRLRGARWCSGPEGAEALDLFTTLHSSSTSLRKARSLCVAMGLRNFLDHPRGLEAVLALPAPSRGADHRPKFLEFHQNRVRKAGHLLVTSERDLAAGLTPNHFLSQALREHSLNEEGTALLLPRSLEKILQRPCSMMASEINSAVVRPKDTAAMLETATALRQGCTPAAALASARALES